MKKLSHAPASSYIERWQKPVPPEASPPEPGEIVYIDEPSVKLEGEWNLAAKLCTQFRFTDEYARRWKEKYRYLPGAEEMTDRDFFQSFDLDWMAPVGKAAAGEDFALAKSELLSYFHSRGKGNVKRFDTGPAGAEEQVVEKAESLLNDPGFPVIDPDNDHESLWYFLRYFEQANCYTGDSRYLNAWLGIFNEWYHLSRPPAQKPLVYIGFIWMRDWSTLVACARISAFARVERMLRAESGTEADMDSRINLYKSILEHARFLATVNDTFLPSNWQIHQMHSLLEVSVFFPEYRESENWKELAWLRLKEHMQFCLKKDFLLRNTAVLDHCFISANNK